MYACLGMLILCMWRSSALTSPYGHMMDRPENLLRPQWITGPTENEDDRVYGPMHVLSTLEFLHSLPRLALARISRTPRPLHGPHDWVHMREASMHLCSSS